MVVIHANTTCSVWYGSKLSLHQNNFEWVPNCILCTKYKYCLKIWKINVDSRRMNSRSHKLCLPCKKKTKFIGEYYLVPTFLFGKGRLICMPFISSTNYVIGLK